MVYSTYIFCLYLRLVYSTYISYHVLTNINANLLKKGKVQKMKVKEMLGKNDYSNMDIVVTNAKKIIALNKISKDVMNLEVKKLFVIKGLYGDVLRLTV